MHKTQTDITKSTPQNNDSQHTTDSVQKTLNMILSTLQTNREEQNEKHNHLTKKHNHLETMIETLQTKLAEESENHKERNKNQDKILKDVIRAIQNLEHIPELVSTLETKTAKIQSDQEILQERVTQN